MVVREIEREEGGGVEVGGEEVEANVLKLQVGELLDAARYQATASERPRCCPLHPPSALHSGDSQIREGWKTRKNRKG